VPMRILVTGAGGYIGTAVCDALRRNGHLVYGLIRKEELKNNLIKREIMPIVGDMSDLKSLSNVLEEVSVVIDTTLVMGADPMAANRSLMNAIGAASKFSKKRFIYTSGVLVYGDYPGCVVDETTPTKGFKPRADFEKEVTSSTAVDGVVIRPGFVYGGSSGYYVAKMFEENDKGEIDINGNPNKSWSWVHLNDLADAYVLVVEAARSLVAGEVFNVSDDTRITYGAAREAMARAGGSKAKVVSNPCGADFFSQLLEVTAVASSDKLYRTLGWHPRSGPFVDNIALYAASAKAYRK